MKISEAIEKLVEIQQKHGDCEVFSGPSDSWHEDIEEIYAKDNGYGIVRVFVGN